MYQHLHRRFRFVMVALLLLVLGAALSGANSSISLASAPTGSSGMMSTLLT